MGPLVCGRRASGEWRRVGYSKARLQGASRRSIPKVSVPVLAAGVGGAADAAPGLAERWGGLRARDAVRPARGSWKGGRRGAPGLLAADAM